MPTALPPGAGSKEETGPVPRAGEGEGTRCAGPVVCSVAAVVPRIKLVVLGRGVVPAGGRGGGFLR